MTTDRVALVAWLTALLDTELPLRGGQYFLEFAPETAAVTVEGNNLCVHLRLCSPHVVGLRALSLLSLVRAEESSRAEAFVRGWCAALRRVFSDLSTSSFPEAPSFTVTDLGYAATLASILNRTALKHARDFEEALLEWRIYGRFCAMPPTLADAALERVHAVIADQPPLVKNDVLVLRALTVPWDDPPPPGPSRGGARVHYSGVVAALEIVFPNAQFVKAPRQQEIEFVTTEHLGDLDRVEAYLRAWRACLAEHAELYSPSEAVHLFPQDLTCAIVLSVQKAKTVDDFRDAIAKRWQFRERAKLRRR
jgi:hypothetical protein